MPKPSQTSTSGTAGTAGINRLIASAFRVRLVSDVPERLARSPLPYRPNAKRRERITTIQRRGVLFIHVPKNAGTSVCHQLYGTQIKHETVRYYASVAPRVLDLPSFAILRDPVCRFLSAFAYASNGGTRDRKVARPSTRATARSKPWTTPSTTSPPRAARSTSTTSSARSPGI